MAMKIWMVRAGRVVSASVVMLGTVIPGVGKAHAQSLQHVTYVGGTALPTTGLHGRVSIASTDVLEFEGQQKLAIPYDHLFSYESRVHRVVHVGLLTEGLWRLIAPWPEEKHLSLSYRDSDDHKQVVVLGMSRADEALLVEVLKTRTSGTGVRPAMTLRPIAATRSAVEISEAN